MCVLKFLYDYSISSGFKYDVSNNRSPLCRRLLSSSVRNNKLCRTSSFIS